jgi:BirA family transcriptional regulator, biotin operon repressor / biotin---[acetyl-CoA-carboxylase] ligase
MSTQWLGARPLFVAECGSTNDEAARLARAGAAHGTVIVADRQTGGRGRMGRVWASPPGGNLYFSCVLRPRLSIAQTPALALAAGIAVCDALRDAGASAHLKWPNDVLVDGRKISGVLLEAQSQGARLEAVVVGVGVNLCGTLPDELRDTATTLLQHVNDPSAASRDQFLPKLCAHLQYWIDRYMATGVADIVEAWRRRMMPGLAMRVSVAGQPLLGIGEGIDEDGALLLRDAAGTLHRISAGDVELVRPASFSA